MRSLRRRQVLRGLLALGGAPLVGWSFGCAGEGGEGLDELELDPPPDWLTADPFTLGVASGDPLADAVVLWTRLAMMPLDGGGMSDDPVQVGWQVATDEDFEEVVVQGVAVAQPDLAHSVHVDATGLPADARLYYRFIVGDFFSPVGRTRTAPSGEVEMVRLAVASCQDWRDGYYTAYEDLVSQEPDLVCFVGDYIYENGGDGVRAHNTDEAVDLEGYRDRYAQYRTDPALATAHAACPWIVTWDDHEVDNNYAPGHPDADADFQGDFEARRAAAYQAYWEHMPIRRPAPDALPRDWSTEEFKLYRALEWGGLATFVVGDTRQYRRDQACEDGETAPCDDYDDPDWQLLGPQQEAWLLEHLRTSTASWKLFVQSLVMSDTSLGSPALRTWDQWDGYPAQRRRILEALDDDGVRGFMVLSGDRHAAVLGQLHRVIDDVSTPRVGVEVSANSITSDGTPGAAEAAFKANWANSDAIPYAFAERRGYALVTLRADEADIEFRTVDDVLVQNSGVSSEARFSVSRETLDVTPR